MNAVFVQLLRCSRCAEANGNLKTRCYTTTREMFWRRLPQDRSSTGAQKTMPRNVLYYPELESKCTSMGHHARQFLSVWEFEHIKGVARTNRQEQARLLAEKCRDDA